MAGVRIIIPNNMTNIATPMNELFVRTTMYMAIVREKAEGIS